VDIVAALIESENTPIAPVLPPFDHQLDGFFLSPDYELTTLVMRGRAGILRAAADSSDVVLLRPDVPALVDRSEVAEAMDVLARLDRTGVDWRQDLVAAVYYLRCAFACLGAHNDEIRPLLGQGDPDLGAGDLPGAVEGRRTGARSAWDLVLAWDRDAEAIRALRIQIHAAADIAVVNRDLRTMVETAARANGLAEPPSLNRVRRSLSRWATDRLVAQFGPVTYPVADLARLLVDLRRAADGLRPEIPTQVQRIVAEAGQAVR
jgi:hypothetical protein